MKLRRHLSIVTAAALAAIAAAAAAPLAGPPTYDLSWYTIDGGGGTSAGGTFVVSGTIGQPDAGAVMTGGRYTVTGGFWAGGIAPSTCPADIANNDGLVNLFDLLELLSNWGSSGPGASLAAPNDVVNLFDLLELLAAWGLCD